MKKISLLFIATLIIMINSIPVFAQTVVFNWKTLKFHKPSCEWAQKCTKNCTKVDKKEAIKHGGKPCKVCGG